MKDTGKPLLELNGKNREHTVLHFSMEQEAVLFSCG